MPLGIGTPFSIASLRSMRLAQLDLKHLDPEPLSSAPKVLEQCLLGILRPKVCDPTEIVDHESLDQIHGILESIQQINASPTFSEPLELPSNDEFILQSVDIKLAKSAADKPSEEFTIVVMVIPFTDVAREQNEIKMRLEQWASERNEEQEDAALLLLSTDKADTKFYVKTSESSPVSEAQIEKFYQESLARTSGRLNQPGQTLLNVVSKIREFYVFHRR